MQRLETAINALKNGQMVILIDSEDRENEGDLVLAAQFATPEKINFLIRQACGLVCLALENDQVERLGLPPMVTQNQSPRKTAFTVSIEAAEGVTTGISAADRAHTIQIASNPSSMAKDIVSPGHIFPLKAVKGGVLERAGHTEGSIELCKLAGLRPAAVICEIINDDGTMARKPDLEAFAKKHGIPIVTIEELIEYLSKQFGHIAESSEAHFPNRFVKNPTHELSIQAFKNQITGDEHALVFTKNITECAKDACAQPPLVRIHSECLTGDTLGSLRCDCGEQLEKGVQAISESPSGGAIVYLNNQEGRGIGFFNKIEAYALQDQGLDTFDANIQLGFQPDERTYIDAAQILRRKGLTTIRLMTNNPRKIEALQAMGITITERVPILTEAHADNETYLKTKRERLDHQLSHL